MPLSFSKINSLLKQPAPAAVVPVRIAVLADFAPQLLATALRGHCRHASMEADVYEGAFGAIEQEVLDSNSGLYAFAPEVVLIAYSAEALRLHFYGLDAAAQAQFSETFLAKIEGLCSALRASLPGVQVVVMNLVELPDAVYGQYGHRAPRSFLRHTRLVNAGLTALATRLGVDVCDAALGQAMLGREAWSHPATRLQASMPFSPAATLWLAEALTAGIAARKGHVRKCLVADLDNTLWGGVIGDDGLAGIELGSHGLGRAFTELQHWMLQLKERGIVLAVCSKNSPDVAREPFLKHPDMVLKLDDIAVFVANWETKVDNILFIRDTLNIGLDAMVFLDDNPFEREMVQSQLPAVCVPDLPDDPAAYLEYLQGLYLFETAGITAEDADRTRLYQEAAAAGEVARQYADEGSFLQSLEMQVRVMPFDEFTRPRVAQLSQRSNQWNLRTVRYTEDEVAAIAADPTRYGLAFELSDRLSRHGIIAVVVLQEKGHELFIENWMMSCRVLKRGMEAFILNELVALAKSLSVEELSGEYLPTAKNALVANHYRDMGFMESNGRWRLAVAGFEPRQTFINRVPQA